MFYETSFDSIWNTDDISMAFDVKTKKSSHSVCGKRFACQGSEHSGFFWKQDDQLEGVRGCKIDPLIAAAHSLGCSSSTLGTGASHCMTRSNPCLADGTGKIHCVSSDSSKMPNAMDGALSCLQETEYPSTATYELDHVEQLDAGFSWMVLKPKEGLPPVAAKSAAPEDPVALEDPPMTPAAPADTPKTCQWFKEKASLACNADTQCPIPEATEFDVWFDTLEPEEELEVVEEDEECLSGEESN